MSDLKQRVAALARRQGFVRMAVAAAREDLEARALTLARVAQGNFAGLPWFDERRVARATDPSSSLPGARSLILLAAPYGHPEPKPDGARLRGRISRYAWGKDYHRVLEKRARPLLALIAESAPGARSRLMVDHGPLLERAYARAAGIGWQGKNTMILAQGIGSYTFLAAILTTVELEPDAPAAPSCGACQRCLPSCPTGALRSEYEVVNDLCISHQTIENRGSIPRELRPLMGSWVFGCDLCQEVCPVNEVRRPEGFAEFAPSSLEDARPDLVGILSLTEEEFRRRFAGRAVLRAKYAGLLRNACVALGNLGDPRSIPALTRALRHREPLVRGHAAWALGRLGATTVLAAFLTIETDPGVREEISLALEEDSPAGEPIGEVDARA